MFSLYESSLGIIRIDYTQTAIIGITVDDNSTGGERSAISDRCAVQINEYLSGRRKAFDFPIEMRGSDFQLRVWREMAKIPYGSVMSYSGLAGAIGNPRACRAVGGACNKNHLLLVIPCHRVVSSSGIGGFEYGVEMKEKLLKLERENL